ncbi:MAG: hypothetical protein RLY97_1417 [Pseudomonadota bacterium]
MPTDIKICGITTPAALDAAIKSRATHAGFVFFPPSPRHLTLPAVATLSARAAARITRIGLFVNPSDADIADAIAAAQLDGIQLHGSESPARTAQIRAQFALPVWKALSIATESDVAKAENYTAAADLILFDAKTPKGAALPGGMGLSFDWNLVSGWKSSPWGLAGGLNPANVADAIRQTGAPLVDTSSGVESAPGIKDVDKIAAFAYAARNC